MKIITLNIWGGYVFDPLVDFFKQNQDVDVFCFQEVYNNAPGKVSTDDRKVCLDIFDRMREYLPNHRGYFRPVVSGVFGLAMFIHERVPLLHEGDIIIHENPDYPGFGPAHSRNMQWIECMYKGEPLAILNAHCLWNGKGKGDSERRIEQSKRIQMFMSTLSIPKVLCGDFNLRPETKSMAILNKGMSNLVSKYQVTSTRTSFYPKEERFADYILLSPKLKETHFEVMPDEVSDHSALLVELD